MADSLNLAGVAEDLAAHALDNKEHIFSKLLIPGIDEGKGPIKPISSYMQAIPATDEVVLTELFVNTIVQPGKKDTFNPKLNAAGFKTRIGKVREMKIDVLFEKTKVIALKKSYLGQVRGGSIDPEVLPFEEFLADAIVRKAKEDIRSRVLFNGVYDAAGTDAEDCADGVKTLVLADIASGAIPSGNVVNTAVLSASNAVAEIEKIIDAIPTEYLYGDMVCVTNRAVKNFYERNYRSTFGGLNYNLGYEKPVFEGTQIEIIVEPGLDGFNRPLFIPRNNLVYLYDDEGAMTDLQVDYDKRTRSIAWVADFQAGINYAIAELIWTTDGV